MDTAVWTLLISSFLAAIGWLFKSEREKRAAVENQLSDKKYAAYQSVIELFTDMINSVRLNKPLDQEDVVTRIIGMSKELIIYGSDPVLKTFSYYRQNASEQTPIRNLKLFYNIMIEIRRDMGHPKTQANEDDLLGVFISDYADLREQILNMK